MGNDISSQGKRRGKGSNKRGNTKGRGSNDSKNTSEQSLAQPVRSKGKSSKRTPDDGQGEKRIVTMEPSVRSFAGPNSNRRDRSDPVMITDALSDVRAKYHINPKELGHGHYGVVRKCMDRETKGWYAIKSIRKSKVSKIEVLKREIAILQEVKHPHIIELRDVFEDSKYLHLVTELCTGGELFDRIIAKTKSKEGHFSERDAACLVRDIMDAIAYCHDVKGIVHRDLKPENFLFLTEADDSPIKIIDFGLSRHNDTNQGIMKTKVGTPYYVAPEVLRREYTKSCDIWSIGVISYILLCGYPPFYGDSDTEIFDSVRTGKFDFPSPEWDDISQTAKDFVIFLLQKDAKKRPTAAEAMEHKWIKTYADTGKSSSKRSSVVTYNARSTTFQKFMAIQKLKKAALVVIATNLTEDQVGSLGDIFKQIDKSGDGRMTLTDLDNAISQGEFPQEIQDNINALKKELSLTDNDALNWKEFLAAAMDKNLVMREDKVRIAFDHFRRSDADWLTLDDFKTIFEGEEAQAMEVFTILDGDGDGKVLFEDFKNAIELALDPSDVSID
eukprot:CAMPEP_0119570136 /NCGR_PEP_ID=MMETSP1352-20130426/43459_1 /TAXON_ID=265584 /ORGANISM="Stauroneis constricta, Strain CCMP1120" /LENGTH=556 /DNA_ID=CAMNT_0007619801 /DNA_START=741 /DNA_END=2411 /DNA_ORIENTATION=+